MLHLSQSTIRDETEFVGLTQHRRDVAFPISQHASDSTVFIPDDRDTPGILLVYDHFAFRPAKTDPIHFTTKFPQ